MLLVLFCAPLVQQALGEKVPGPFCCHDSNVQPSFALQLVPALWLHARACIRLCVCLNPANCIICGQQGGMIGQELLD